MEVETVNDPIAEVKTKFLTESTSNTILEPAGTGETKSDSVIWTPFPTCEADAILIPPDVPPTIVAEVNRTWRSGLGKVTVMTSPE